MIQQKQECSECGSFYDSTVPKCPYCGAKTGAIEEDRPTAQLQPPPPVTTPVDPHQEFRLACMIGALMIVGFGVLVLAMMELLTLPVTIVAIGIGAASIVLLNRWLNASNAVRVFADWLESPRGKLAAGVILAVCLLSVIGPWHGGPPDPHDLFSAVEGRDVARLTKLLKDGADPNFAGSNSPPISGGTALHLASCVRFGEGITCLLDAGADPNARDSEGQTPLHNAAGAGFADGAAQLVAAGSNVNARDSYGYTPLHMVALRGDADPVKQRVFTKLSEAQLQDQYQEQLTCVGVLLVAGADTQARDQEENQTPLEFAVFAKNETVAQVLREWATQHSQSPAETSPAP